MFNDRELSESNERNTLCLLPTSVWVGNDSKLSNNKLRRNAASFLSLHSLLGCVNDKFLGKHKIHYVKYNYSWYELFLHFVVFIALGRLSLTRPSLVKLLAPRRLIEELCTVMTFRLIMDFVCRYPLPSLQVLFFEV